jgi:hypothetical protein
MALHNPKKKPLSEVGPLGVALKKKAHHIGILYRRHDKPQPRLWHFAEHFDLRDEDCDSSYFWGESGLDPQNKNYVAAWITSRDTQADKIPYGFDITGQSFEQGTGKFIAPPIGKGFTCATFVTAVFQHLGFDLLDEASWPFRMDDVAWQNSYLPVLEKRCKDKLHVDAVANDLGARRIRPPEVAAGMISGELELPLAFPSAEALAARIMADLAG